MRIPLFFLIFTGIIGLAHWYVGRRLVSASRLTPKRRRIGWMLIAMSFVLCMSPMFARFVLKALEDTFGWAGFVTMGFFSIVAILTVGRDLIHLVLRTGHAAARFVEKLSTPVTHSAVAPADPERRRLLIASSNLAIIGLSGVLTGYGVVEARRRPRVLPIDVPMPNLPPEFNGFKIVQLTDIHAGPTIKRDWVEMVVSAANDTGADMVVFTGDLVDGTVPYLRDDTAPIRDLNARFGRFFVTGNHEYYSGVLPWLEEIDRLGWDILINEHRVIEKDGARLIVAGVTDYSAGGSIAGHKSDPAVAIAGAPSGIPRMLLAHQPKSVYEASASGFDLQLSGHTHGGQFFPWDNLARLAQPYVSGLHRHDNMWVYVSRGTGYWGPPVRIGQPSEITLVTLRRGPISKGIPQEQARQ